MKRTTRFAVAATAALALAGGLSTVAPHADARADRLTAEGRAVQQLTRANTWTPAASIPLAFDTFHMQGMTLVGDTIWISSVEILEKTVKYPAPVDGMDRTAGRGRGRVFVITCDGRLVKDIVVGEGDMYHPGGIDFDGRQVWVPVAEYRPHSHSVVYTIDPRTYAVHERFRTDEHVGGVVHDVRKHRVAAVTWGSRELLTLKEDGRVIDEVRNPSAVVDHQDCEHAGEQNMVCTGITELKDATGAKFELGGIALVDERTGVAVNEVPVQVFSNNGWL